MTDKTLTSYRDKERKRSKEIEAEIRPMMLRACDGNMGPQFEAMVKDMVRIINGREIDAYSRGFNQAYVGPDARD